MTVAELTKELKKFDENEQVGLFNPASGDWSAIDYIDQTVETECTHWNGKVITIWPADDPVDSNELNEKEQQGGK